MFFFIINQITEKSFFFKNIDSNQPITEIQFDQCLHLICQKLYQFILILIQVLLDLKSRYLKYINQRLNSTVLNK